MRTLRTLSVVAIAGGILIAGCVRKEELGLPNPASVYCEEQGGTLEMREGPEGTTGFCIFEDGSECDEWAFFRGECQPGETTGGAPGSADPQMGDVGLPNPASVYCEEQGGTVEMREGPGGTAGFCIFEGGSECDEWAFFRGECQPGEAGGK